MKKVNVEKSLIEEAIKQRITKKQFCSDNNISVDILNARCREYGIQYCVCSWKKGKEMPWRKYPQVDKQWLIDNWVNTSKSLSELANLHSIPYALLENRRAKYDVKKPNKYLINKHKLLDLKDYHLYYLAGLFITDGYYDKEHGAINIGLTGRDEYALLCDINNYYEHTNIVRQYKNTQILRFVSRELVSLFETKLNITAINKTYNVEGPVDFPSEDCAKAYIRGCIDGDGCIGLNGKSLSLYTSSLSLIKNITQIIKDYTGIYRNVLYQNKKYPGFEAGGKTAISILDWVYDLEDCFMLKRKYDRYRNQS